MKIKYLGHSSFKITGKTLNGEQITVITDPFDKKEVGLNFPSQSGDIITISHHHSDHNNVENIKGTDKTDEPFVIDTPGEYEVKGLRIFGLKSYHDDKQGKERGSNTIYVYDFEEARIAHLGDLGHPLESNQLEELEGIEILMVPVGGDYTINPETAMQVIESIEPLIVIPMHYKTSKHSGSFDKLATLEDFLNEAGVQAETKDEVSIKTKSDLPQNLTIIPLSA